MNVCLPPLPCYVDRQHADIRGAVLEMLASKNRANSCVGTNQPRLISFQVLVDGFWCGGFATIRCRDERCLCLDTPIFLHVELT